MKDFYFTDNKNEWIIRYSPITGAFYASHNIIKMLTNRRFDTLASLETALGMSYSHIYHQVFYNRSFWREEGMWVLADKVEKFYDFKDMLEALNNANN